jgi:hypothetical protein
MVRTSRPVATSQIVTRCELDPAAMARPSGENASLPTAYPLMPRSSRPAARSQSLIVRSALLAANRRPSGEKTAEKT